MSEQKPTIVLVHGVSAPGSTLGDTLDAYPVATQRPVTQAALGDLLVTDRPAWRDVPSWHVFGDQDRNIPVAVHRAGASHAVAVSQPGAVAAVIAEAVDAVRASREATV